MRALIQLLAYTILPTAIAIADADIAVTNTVNNELPAPGEPVEFTIEAVNIGDSPAIEVVVVDALSPDLEIPPGAAAFSDTGTYDPESGEWTIGTLEAGQSAILVLPAVLVADGQVSCVANTAVLGIEDIEDDANDASTAVIRRNAIDRCVDLNVDFSISDGPLVQICDQHGRYDGDVRIANLGPDAALDVAVTMEWVPLLSQNVRFSDLDCVNEPGALCVIETIAPGEVITIDVTSDDYQSYTSESRTVTISATTADVDYEQANNTQSVTGRSRAFSHCLDIDLPDDVAFPVGPSCFIATAAYGTPFDSRIDVLREFRDEHMLDNSVGRALVAFYYKYSPPIADYIAERDWLRAIVRLALAPIVFAVGHSAFALAMALAIAGTVMSCRRRTFRRNRSLVQKCAIRRIPGSRQPPY